MTDIFHNQIWVIIHIQKLCQKSSKGKRRLKRWHWILKNTTSEKSSFPSHSSFRHISIFTAYLWHGQCQNGYLQLGQGVLEVLLLLLSQLDPESRRQQQGNLCSGPLLTAIKQKQTSWWTGSSHVPVCIYVCMWLRGGLIPPTTQKGNIGDFICAFCYTFLCILV